MQLSNPTLVAGFQGTRMEAALGLLNCGSTTSTVSLAPHSIDQSKSPSIQIQRKECKMTPSDEGSSKVYMIRRPSCLTLCDPMDCSPPGYSVRGILQARKLEWVAMSRCIHLSLWADSNLCMEKKEPHFPGRYLRFNLLIWWITQTSQGYKVTSRGYLDISNHRAT